MRSVLSPSNRSRAYGPATLLLGLAAASITSACIVSPESGPADAEWESLDSGAMDTVSSQMRPVSSAEGAADPEMFEETAGSEDEVRSKDQELTSNGCSNPQFLEAIQQMLHPVPASLKTLFKSACDTHDYCYSSGKAFYGLSRATCDYNFGVDLQAKCAASYPLPPLNPVLAACQLTATEFTAAVKIAGASHYEGTPCVVGQTNTTECSTYEPYLTSAPNSKDYILYTTTAGGTYRVVGSPSSGSTQLPGTATALGAYAFRGGYITGGTLNMIEGEPANATTVFTSPAAAFKVSGNRIGAIFTNMGFYLQEGALLGSWTSGISAHLLDLDQDRVVVASRGAKYSVWLKKGAVGNAWKEILTSPSEEIQQLSVNGSRIAVTRSYKVMTTDNDGTTWTASPFGWVDNTMTKIAGSRLGMVVGVNNNTRWDLKVTDSDPKNNSYVTIAQSVSAWDVTSSRMAVITAGNLWLQEGGITTAFRKIGPAQSVKLSGNRVAFVNAGNLYVKDGTIGDSWTTLANWTKVATNVKDYSIWQKGDYNSKDYVNVIK